MRIQTKRKFIWTALIGFSFWLMGSILYNFQLYPTLEQGGIDDFEEAFQEQSAQLAKELGYFAQQFPENGTEEERFALAEQFEAET